MVETLVGLESLKMKYECVGHENNALLTALHCSTLKTAPKETVAQICSFEVAQKWTMPQ